MQWDTARISIFRLVFLFVLLTNSVAKSCQLMARCMIVVMTSELALQPKFLDTQHGK